MPEKPSYTDLVQRIKELEQERCIDGPLADEIAERKEMEQELRESEEKFRAMIETLPLAIYLTSRVENISEYMNPFFINQFGYTLEEVPRVADWFDLAYPDPVCREQILTEWNERVQRAIETQTRSEPMETMVTCKDGSEKSVLWGYVCTGEKNYVYGVDLTERKLAEAKNAKLQGQLNQMQKMESVGRLAGGVAHDFNNMLGVILGHAEMAMGRLEETDPNFNDFMEISKAAERSANMTRQLLAFARKQTVAPKQLDLNQAIEEMHKMLQRLIGEDLDLRWRPGAGLWAVKIDPSQLDQMLVNLCVNAKDAIADVGHIFIETKNATFDQAYCGQHPGFIPGEYVRLTVSDDGCGMDQEVQASIFDPFFTTKELGKGTGLGLATVFGAVKQNNGFINVYSELGQGTRFSIYLPRDTGTAKQESGNKVLVEATTRGNETILLVEDEPSILKITTSPIPFTTGNTITISSS